MVDVFGIDALSVLIFGPALSAFVVAAIASFGTSKQVGRWLALLLSLLFAILSIKVFVDYQAAGLAIGDEQYIVAQDVAWFEALGARWTLGIDGISAVMILLTGLLTPLAILAIPAATLIGFAFGAVGMAASTFMRSWQDFDLVVLFMLPLFLFSATFYPLDVYPPALRALVQLSPLYHGVEIIRAFTLHSFDAGLLGHVAYLVAIGSVGLMVAGRRLGTLLKP